MKKENKKKVVTLSAMAALLAVVLGMGGKTYAKYFTSNTTDGDSATVAKWGLVSNLKDDTLGSAFKKTYNNGSVESQEISSSVERLVVAPGTAGSISFTTSGTAEVDALINFSVNSYTPISLSTVAADSTKTVVYTPIEWTVELDGGTASPITDFAAYTQSFEYDANTSAAHTIKLNWSWDFDDNGNGTNDTYDTILGQISNGTAVSGYDAVTTMSYTVSVSMTQVKK